MSTKDYLEAEQLLERNEEICDFVGEVSEEIVMLAEKKLNLKFTDLYRNFILKYGAGNFGSIEIYGIIKEEFENSGIPDSIWYTLKQRKEINLPNNLIIIYHTGGDEVFCIDVEDKAKIVSFVLGLELELQRYEVIAEDFGEFLLKMIKMELEVE